MIVSTSASRVVGPPVSMPVYYVDHQYHTYASVSHPLPPPQNSPVTVVARSSTVYPTAQHSYLIPVRSSSVDPTRSDHVVIGRSDGCCVSEQHVYRVLHPPLQQPPVHVHHAS